MSYDSGVVEASFNYNKASREVLEAMRLRCEQERHDYENGMTAGFHVVRICQWCGDRSRY